eukprot:Skav216142  [mRNA]  locus=scaffold1946:420151:420582:+ [translate_table: standard]
MHPWRKVNILGVHFAAGSQAADCLATQGHPTPIALFQLFACPQKQRVTSLTKSIMFIQVRPAGPAAWQSAGQQQLWLPVLTLEARYTNDASPSEGPKSTAPESELSNESCAAGFVFLLQLLTLLSWKSPLRFTATVWLRLNGA